MAAQAVLEQAFDNCEPVAQAGATRLHSGDLRFCDLPRAHAVSGDVDNGISPRLCHAWADAIALFWENLLANGRIDPKKPLYVLDLAPADGRLAWRMLTALSKRLAGSPCAALRPHYLACCTDHDALDALAAHPYLARHLEQGYLDAAAWLPDNRAALRLRSAEIDLACTDNPVVCLAWRYFEALPSELYGIDHGEILDARIRMDDGLDCAHPLHYTWTPLASEPGLRGALLAHYASRCANIPLMLPLAACEMLDRLAHLSGGRTLLLSADHGVCTEQQLRLHACIAPDTWSSPFRLPVNVHALTLAQQWQGATTWCSQLDAAGLVLQMAWCDDSGLPSHETIATVIAALQQTHPDDGTQLAAIAAAWCPAQAIVMAPALLRLSLCDPMLLKACIKTLIESTPVCNESAIQEWRALLGEAWANYMPPSECDLFYRDLAIFAARLGYWGLAKDCFRTGLGMYGDEPGDLHDLAYCEAASGSCETALALLARGLELEPGHPGCVALHDRLSKRVAIANDTPGYHADLAGADGLTLEPLHAAHAPYLLYQYRDAQIGVITCLPELNSTDQAVQWIAQQRGDAGRTSYAVMHACWGFVGVVSMHRHADTGYFYFWIGTDFQDRGFGPQAASLLWEQETRNGVSSVFTSVYADNGRSRRALDLLGFKPLAIRALAPDDDLIFLGKSLGTAVVDELTAHTKIRALCTAIESPIQFRQEQEECMTTPQH